MIEKEILNKTVEKRQMTPQEMDKQLQLLAMYSTTGEHKYLEKAIQYGKDHDKKTYEGYIYK